MISVEEALQLIESTEVEHKVIQIPLSKALNYTLAEEVVSPMNMPSFPQSAMDGYAVNGYGRNYHVTGEIKAGDTHKVTLQEGESVRIFTGAAVPETATSVVMQEKVQRDGDKIVVDDELVEGKNIRPEGEQIQEGKVVFGKGQRLNPAALGLLQSLGFVEITVFRKPKISLLVTGNELKTPGTVLNHGEIYESNSITILSAAQQNGFVIGRFEHVVDNYDKTKEQIQKAVEGSDVVILSGGISVGDYDFVGKALDELGFGSVFYKVKQKPGKPIYFGKKGSKFVFGLPGNPAAALTCFYIYVLPFLQRLSGMENRGLKSGKAKLDQSYIKKGDRAHF